MNLIIIHMCVCALSATWTLTLSSFTCSARLPRLVTRHGHHATTNAKVVQMTSFAVATKCHCSLTWPWTLANVRWTPRSLAASAAKARTSGELLTRTSGPLHRNARHQETHRQTPQGTNGPATRDALSPNKSLRALWLWCV